MVRSPINIALIKYWGKRESPNEDEMGIIPLNLSFSVALSMDFFYSECHIEPSVEDSFILNGAKQAINERMRRVIGAARKISCCSDYIRIISASPNLPTGAGLASSASGYSALARALFEYYGLRNPKDLELLARLGSGSSCSPSDTR